MKHLFLLLTIFAGATCAADAQIAAGGNYSIEKSVTANGGASGAGASGSGIYTVEGTIGQNAAGTTQQNSPFKFQPGFWTAQAFAPTAASVNLGGRVMTATGRGIRNARVTLTMPDGTMRTTISGTFGYYRFADIPAGETYILTATAKRFVFSVPTQVVSLNEDRDDVDFIGEAVFSQ
ncbi:MAG: carboxypeptidase-like regulatory domain-containing protein [Pyrinomonadaceae bacterium]|nr:carboxypeptidase-like regulatory domain-containing protein [Pyrinomonadaceae bacterium]